MSGFRDLKKTWFLVPTHDIPPSAIRLGYLIAKPLEPRYPINPVSTGTDGSPNLDQSATIDTEIFKDVEGPLSVEVSSDSSTTLGIFATFLQAIGINAELKLTRSGGIKNKYTFEETKTEWFSPSLAFVGKVLKTDGVSDLIASMVSAVRKKPLYMITGVKTATGASLSTSYSKGREYNAMFGIDGTAGGAPVSAGPAFQRSSNENNIVESSKKGPIVFAYQLMRVNFKEAGTTVESFTHGAAFAIGDEDDETEIEIELSEEAPESDLTADYGGLEAGKTEVLESFDETTKESCSVVALVH